MYTTTITFAHEYQNEFISLYYYQNARDYFEQVKVVVAQTNFRTVKPIRKSDCSLLRFW